MARSTPLHALVASLALIGTVLVVFQPQDDKIPSELVVRPPPLHRELDLDPKTVNSKVTVSTDAADSSIASGIPDRPLPPLPNPLEWRKVSDVERAATPTCSKEAALDYCCIGKCKKPSNRLKEAHFDNLFYQPDMEDIVTMEGLLPFIHGFRDRVAYPTCTLWFIGDSTTEDQSMAAVCQLLNLGYELDDCPIVRGHNDNGDCTLTSTTSQYCPRVRVKTHKHGSWHLRGRGGYNQGSDMNFTSQLDQKQNEDEAGVVIYSWGVHIHTREEFTEWMPGPFQRLYDAFQTLPDPGRYAFMWREHEPQHFNSPGGLYIGKRTYGCYDVQEFDNFRNEEMHKYFDITGLGNIIPVIESYDALKPMHMFHDRNGDCSHYCYTPWRFDLTWHGVALGLRDMDVRSRQSQ